MEYLEFSEVQVRKLIKRVSNFKKLGISRSFWNQITTLSNTKGYNKPISDKVLKFFGIEKRVTYIVPIYNELDILPIQEDIDPSISFLGQNELEVLKFSNEDLTPVQEEEGILPKQSNLIEQEIGKDPQ